MDQNTATGIRVTFPYRICTQCRGLIIIEYWPNQGSSFGVWSRRALTDCINTRPTLLLARGSRYSKLAGDYSNQSLRRNWRFQFDDGAAGWFLLFSESLDFSVLNRLSGFKGTSPNTRQLVLVKFFALFEINPVKF